MGESRHRQRYLSLAYPDAKELLITADGGGSNGSRVKLWKVELQKFANETGLNITANSNSPVDWINLNFDGPYGNIYGGGGGVSFEEIAPGVWEYSRTNVVSKYAPSGVYRYSNISVRNKGMLTSDVWLDDVGIEISNPPSLPDTSIRVTGVTLNLDTLILTAGGVPAAITVTIIPSDATNRAVTWTSSAPAVATVDATGLVIAVSAGTATITVTTEDGGHTATSVITVVVPVTAPAPAPALAPVAPAPAPAAVVEQRVAAGRPTVVKLEGVVEITVTAGAVTGDAPKITAQVLPEAAASPMLVRAVEAGLVAVGGVVQLTLTGGEFAGSVQFTLNFDAAKVAAGRVPSVFVYNERTGRWIYLGGQVGNGTVTVTVDRFSKFAVFASRPLPALADIATHWGRDSIRTRALCLIC